MGSFELLWLFDKEVTHYSTQISVTLTACCGIFRDVGSFSAFIDIVFLVMGKPFISFCSTNFRTFFVTGIEISVLGPITCFLVNFFPYIIVIFLFSTVIHSVLWHGISVLWYFCWLLLYVQLPLIYN